MRIVDQQRYASIGARGIGVGDPQPKRGREGGKARRHEVGPGKKCGDCLRVASGRVGIRSNSLGEFLGSCRFKTRWLKADMGCSQDPGQKTVASAGSVRNRHRSDP